MLTQQCLHSFCWLGCHLGPAVTGLLGAAGMQTLGMGNEGKPEAVCQTAARLGDQFEGPINILTANT